MSSSQRSTGVHRLACVSVPTSALLESWSGRAWTRGVQVDGLRNLDTLQVRTCNTVYDITVVNAASGEAVIVGGRFFPESRRAVVLGSSLGGAYLKLRGIYCGYSLEVYTTGTRIVTSAVQSVEVLGPRHPGTVQ